MSFELLSEPIRKYIREKRWETLRPIQRIAIERILKTDKHYILSSRTASGKTEAAFLPILSAVDFNEPGVQVIYISPLIALINDQFTRVEELCKYMDVEVTKWHGEASVSGKKNLAKRPTGVVLITPESIEALFCNKPHLVAHLFGNVKFIVIDEIHSFLGTDRGVQLKSILSRLHSLQPVKSRIIGLSATIGDFEIVKRFTGNYEHTVVLRDTTSKPIQTLFKYFSLQGPELPLDIIKDIYRETADNKVLLFPNSRGLSEEIAVKLQKLSKLVGGHTNYFSHHSSVDKELREYVEHFAKTNKRMNFTICCTTTLELGIDIGTVDGVIQVDAAHSIASLIQRVGRSGRRDGETSRLIIYSTNEWSLLQSLACWNLYEFGFIEPISDNITSYDILLHQLLSTVKGTSGITQADLSKRLISNYAFTKVPAEDIELIIEYLLSINFLEKVGKELIIGLDAEKVVNNFEFYSVFITPESFRVIHAGNTIGELPESPMLIPDQNILLAAKIWKIIDVDYRAKRITVVPASDGHKPLFGGGGMNVHSRVRDEMIRILYSNESFHFLDSGSILALKDLRKKFAIFPIDELNRSRPVIVKEKGIIWFTFTGTIINRTLECLLAHKGIKTMSIEAMSALDIPLTLTELSEFIREMLVSIINERQMIREHLQKSPVLISLSKYLKFLPEELQVKVIRDKYFDFPGTLKFLRNVQLVQARTIQGQLDCNDAK